MLVPQPGAVYGGAQTNFTIANLLSDPLVISSKVLEQVLPVWGLLKDDKRDQLEHMFKTFRNDDVLNLSSNSVPSSGKQTLEYGVSLKTPAIVMTMLEYLAYLEYNVEPAM